MVYHLKHEMLAEQTPADEARARYVLALKRHLIGAVRARTGLAYEVEGEPGFTAERGHAPETRGEALSALESTRHYQYWSALNRTSQEMMWQTVGEAIYRDEPRLEAAAQRLCASHPAGGTLTLDPDFKPEAVYRDIDIHLQPHSYVSDDPDGHSVRSGVFYEMGGRLYSMGRGMAARDSKASAVMGHVESLRPGWRPKRMLDMGCSAGGASAAYALEWPETEVHAIDLGSSMLRYAHARAESLGAAVHFHQMDASRTGFPDGHFDLIVSHNLFHEISTGTRRRIAGETFRLLAPGGLALHQDVDLLFRGKSLWQEAERAWDLYHNNEPFWVDYAECDFASELKQAGFDEGDVGEGPVSKTDGPGAWYVFRAEKPAA